MTTGEPVVPTVSETDPSKPGDERARAPRAGLPDEQLGGWFWVGLVVGAAVIGYGVWGAFSQEVDAQPLRLLRFAISSLLAHDVLVAPAVTIGGIALAHFLPAWLRGPVRGALALSGIVVVFSYPLLRGFGRHELNDSTLPLDYGRNVMIVLGVIWFGATVMAIVRWRQVAR